MKRFPELAPAPSGYLVELQRKVKLSPFNYLQPYYNLTRMMENGNNVFPTTSGFGMKYVHIDSRAILEITLKSHKRESLLNLVNGKAYLQDKKPSLTSLKKACVDSLEAKQDIWNVLLGNLSKLKNFHFSIDTDGYGVSIFTGSVTTRTLKRKRGVCENEDTGSNIPYAVDLSDEDKNAFATRPLVAIDPNMRDLLFCISRKQAGPKSKKKKRSKRLRRYQRYRRRKRSQQGQQGRAVKKKHLKKDDYNIFKYTNPQRQRELRSKKFRLRRNRLKPLAVLQAEQMLRETPKSTLLYDDFSETYLPNYFAQRMILHPFYSDIQFRRWRFHRHIKVQRSESKMVQKFIKKFGRDCVVGFGDWSHRGRHLRHLPPTKCGGLRDVLVRAGLTVLVDEYRTSCVCHTKNMKTGRKTYQPLKTKGKMVFETKICNDGVDYSIRVPKMVLKGQRKVLKCGTCGIMWNRDFNSSLYILNMLEHGLKGVARPLIFRRANQNCPTGQS